MNHLSQLAVPIDLNLCTFTLRADELLDLEEGSVVSVQVRGDKVLRLSVGGEPFAEATLIKREDGLYLQIKKFLEEETTG